MFVRLTGGLQSALALMFCAMIAFGAVIATPADAAGLRPEDTRLARMSFDADPLTEAFGARPVMPLDVAHSTKWTDVLRRQESPETVTVPCRDASADQCFETFWSDAVATMKGMPRAEKVRFVNDLINKMGYWSDRDVYREADHWATPAEMFAMGGGDCEDFALFKYFLLRAAGVPAEDMRLTLVAYQDQAHMVALVMVDGEPIVMDCLVMKATPPEQLAQYQAVYSVGETGAWLLAKDDQRSFVQASR